MNFAHHIRALLAGPSAGEAVHFHRGAGGRPRVCYAPRCTSPRLEAADL